MIFFKRFFKSLVKENRPPTIIDNTLKNIEQLEPYDFKHCHSSDLSVFYLKVLFSSITEYTKLLVKATETIKNTEVIYRHTYLTDIKTVPISKCVVGPGNMYVNEIEAAENCLTAARDFLLAYKELISNVELNVTQTHNQNILKQLIQNLFDISESFVGMKNAM